MSSHKTMRRHTYPRVEAQTHPLATGKKESKIKKPVAFEIGGGYGGLALELFTAGGGRITYINCDLSETLYLCHLFLKKTLLKMHVAWAIDHMMGRETIEGYMRDMHRLKPRYFFHQNSNYLLFPKSQRHIEILASEFPIKKNIYREVYAALAPWQGAGGRYREYLYERTA